MAVCVNLKMEVSLSPRSPLCLLQRTDVTQDLFLREIQLGPVWLMQNGLDQNRCVVSFSFTCIYIVLMQIFLLACNNRCPMILSVPVSVVRG